VVSSSEVKTVVNRAWISGALLVSLAAISITGQTPATAPKAASKSKAATKGALPLRTPWGDPDLQGTWFVKYDVPLERSAANAGKEFLTDAEVAAADAKKGVDPGRNARASGAQDVTGAYNAVFNSILKTGKRTSMIIDPPDGKIPVLAAAAQGAGRGGRGGPPGGRGGGNDNPEFIAQSPRCLGVPMPFLPLNTAFAQGTVMQIVQSPKSMSIYMEDDHAGGGNRTIFMDGRPHAPASLKFYLGDSRGHWEGDTLVVDVADFNDQTWFDASGNHHSNALKVIERYTRTGPDVMQYEATMTDPQTFSRPWTIRMDLHRDTDQYPTLLEYECHSYFEDDAVRLGSR